jgi:hypothetical protein
MTTTDISFEGLELVFIDNFREYDQPLITFIITQFKMRVDSRGFDTFDVFKAERMF